MIGAIFRCFVSLSCLVLVLTNAKQRCSFPGQLVSPCRCYQNQVSCKGGKVTDAVLFAVFRNLTTQLPDYMRHIESFELLDSSVKSITPKMFAKVTIRGSIKLRNNQLANFSIGNFDQLFALDVSNNDFTSLALDSFIGLKQLRVLNAANIGLTTLKKEYFSHLKNLQRLDLSGNDIKLVEIDAFTSEYDNNFELREIDLSQNSITRLPENIFLVLRQPERINLANNNLEKVDQIFKFSRDMVQFAPVQIVLSNNSLGNDHFSGDTFEYLHARQHFIELDLSYNKLSWLDQAVFGKLLHEDSRSVLIVDHNPIQCTNCRNRWLLERAQAQPNFLKSVVLRTCIENKQLSDLSLSDFSHCN